MGYVEETGAAQYYRDARIAPIYEGTNGIQAIDLVMRKVPMDGGAAVGTFLDEMDRLAAELAAEGESPPVMRDALKTGVDTLRAATDHLLRCEQVNDKLAAATPYLKMFGIVAGGYYLARLALAARRTGVDDEWHRAKAATAAFYASQIMPQATGLLGAATADAEALFAVGPEHLGG